MRIEYEILSQIISKRDISIIIPDWNDKIIAESVNMVALAALNQIKSIINDEKTSDFEAIDRINEVLENIGLDSERHDW